MVALGFAALVYPRAASAYSCLPPRLLTPLVGTPLPSNGLIWDVCYQTLVVDLPPAELCPPPTLTDAAGRQIELIVDQQVRSTRYARVLTAYRPSEALEGGGTYMLEADDEVSHFTFSYELTVVEADVEAPPVPVLKAVDFSVRQVLDGNGAPFNARFTFEPFEGNLVADPEGLLETPFEGLELSLLTPTERGDFARTAPAWQIHPQAPESDRHYFLAKEWCYVNFQDADWGASASVRFGVLDFAGNFSGWSEPVSIEYPSEVTEYPEVVRERERQHELLYSEPSSGACNLTSHAPSSRTSGVIFLLLSAGMLRRARSRI
jgi:hypothetical protein